MMVLRPEGVTTPLPVIPKRCNRESGRARKEKMEGKGNGGVRFPLEACGNDNGGSKRE